MVNISTSLKRSQFSNCACWCLPYHDDDYSELIIIIVVIAQIVACHLSVISRHGFHVGHTKCGKSAQAAESDHHQDHQDQLYYSVYFSCVDTRCIPVNISCRTCIARHWWTLLWSRQTQWQWWRGPGAGPRRMFQIGVIYFFLVMARYKHDILACIPSFTIIKREI